MDYADLHLHTNRSDGAYSPEELIDKCVPYGFRAIAIVDHDDISAFEEASRYASNFGMEVITGVELSVSYRNYDIHVLAYGFDQHNVDLVNYLNLFREERINRAKNIIENLARMGMPISFEAVQQKAGVGSIGRPHIAQVLLEENYVRSFQEAFNLYLGDGKPANVDKYKMHLDSVLGLISKAGGLSVLAHPGLQLNHDDTLAIIKHGIDGIEVIHPRHKEDDVRYFRKLVKENGLLETGGSDYHGGDRGDEVLGKYKIPYEAVQKIKERTQKSTYRA